MTEKDVMAALTKFREECESRDKETNRIIKELEARVTLLEQDVEVLSKELANHKLSRQHLTPHDFVFGQ